MNTNAKTTSSTAVISLIFGILGWSFLPWLGSIVAIIAGHMARAEIRRNPDTLEGDGLAIAGLALGWVMLALSLLAAIALLLFFGGLAGLVAFLAVTGAGH
jgi:hypothetical protein